MFKDNTHIFSGKTDENQEDRQIEHRTSYLWDRGKSHYRCAALQTSKPGTPYGPVGDWH